MDRLNQQSRRVLVAEDEVAIALDLEAQLRDAGYETVGPAFDAQQASDLIAARTFDAAVLNIALVREAVDTVLQPLVANCTPIVFISGYDPAQLPEWAAAAEICPKPCKMTDLVEALERALGTVAAPG
jgi:DNA-binding NtrC family response regulator